MGRRILRISDTLLSTPFGAGEHHYEVSKGALPKDARIVDARMDFSSGRSHDLILLVESGEWEPNREGDAYLTHQMTFTTLYPREGDFVRFPEAVKS